MLVRRAIAWMLGAFVLAACTSPQPIIVVATNTPAPPVASPTPLPSPTPVPYQDTIVIGSRQEPRTLHPFLDGGDVQLHVLDALYEPYVTSLDFAYQANPNGGLLAGLPTLENGGATLDDAGTPDDPVDDQLTMVFRMLPGPRWCDGTPVTAHDSVYAFNLANDPDSGVTSRLALDRVESYTAVDDATVQVRLRRGVLDPLYMAYFWTPLPQHLWSRYSALELQIAPEAASRPCGYGPYTIAGAESPDAGWIAGQSLTLVANPYYFRGAPATPRLVFRFMPNTRHLLDGALDGSIDLVVGDNVGDFHLPDLVRFQAEGRLRLAAIHAPIWEQIVFNLFAPTDFNSLDRAQPHPILSDARVRQAIAHALDRKALVERVYAGQSLVLDQPLVYPNHPLAARPDELAVYPFDPARAAALLDAAGWVDTDADGVRECRGCTSGAAEGDRLALTYRTTSSAVRDAVVEQVQRDLNAAGFDIAVELLPAEVFFGDVTGLIVGDFDIGQLAGLTDVDPDGERQYSCDYIPSPASGWYGENYAGWCNETASDALGRASQTLNMDERRAAYAVFQREVTRDLPSLPLFPRIDVLLVNPRLENLAANDSIPSVTWNAYALRVLNP